MGPILLKVSTDLREKVLLLTPDDAKKTQGFTLMSTSIEKDTRNRNVTGPDTLNL
jgi:hypothetical protein